ncbi:MAG: hypothetical protein N2319_01420 [Candidatus Kapabacteria bacterium]|nr:hypothetical protein [Candidatus Kapabacteria bacterium]
MSEFLISTTRPLIINNSYVRSLAGNTVPVYMKGIYVLKNSSNEIIERSVDRTGSVEVVQP